MSPQFNFRASRSVEIIDAAVAHRDANLKSGENPRAMPLAAIIVLRCTIEAQIARLGIQAYPESRTPPAEVLDIIHSIDLLCRATIPEWSSEETQRQAKLIAQSFTQDLQDLHRGNS